MVARAQDAPDLGLTGRAMGQEILIGRRVEQIERPGVGRGLGHPDQEVSKSTEGSGRKMKRQGTGGGDGGYGDLLTSH